MADITVNTFVHFLGRLKKKLINNLKVKKCGGKSVGSRRQISYFTREKPVEYIVVVENVINGSTQEMLAICHRKYTSVHLINDF